MFDVLCVLLVQRRKLPLFPLHSLHGKQHPRTLFLESKTAEYSKHIRIHIRAKATQTLEPLDSCRACHRRRAKTPFRPFWWPNACGQRLVVQSSTCTVPTPIRILFRIEKISPLADSTTARIVLADTGAAAERKRLFRHSGGRMLAVSGWSCKVQCARCQRLSESFFESKKSHPEPIPQLLG